MPNSIPKGKSFKESVLQSYQNSSSVYDENFLSSLNVKWLGFFVLFKEGKAVDQIFTSL